MYVGLITSVEGKVLLNMMMKSMQTLVGKRTGWWTRGAEEKEHSSSTSSRFPHRPPDATGTRYTAASGRHIRPA